jgi:LAO/AO transport system kinase
VVTCSSLTKEGVNEVWEVISEYKKHCLNNGYFATKRRMQSKIRMHQTVEEQLKRHFYKDKKIAGLIPSFEKALEENNMSAYVAANKLLDLYYVDIQNDTKQ